MNNRTSILLNNHFHDSVACVKMLNTGILSAGQVRRANRTLCGCADCCCGGVYRNTGLVRRPDGGAELPPWVYIDSATKKLMCFRQSIADYEPVGNELG